MIDSMVAISKLKDNLNANKHKMKIPAKRKK